MEHSPMDISHEERRARIDALNLIDDILFRKVFEDRECCEEMLRVILDKPGLIVRESSVQHVLNNTGNRSVTLDLWCEDEDGSLFGVEMQKADEKNHMRRMRYIRASMDTTTAKTGIGFADLPNIYTVFISTFDPFGKGKTVYHIDHVIRETGETVDDGTYAIFCNAEINDGSDIAELMLYFKNSRGGTVKFKKISGRVNDIKRDPKEEDAMLTKYDRDMLASEARGRAEGRAEGREKGRAEGREEGCAETLVTFVRYLMTKLHMNRDEALEEAKVPVEYRNAVLALLG